MLDQVSPHNPLARPPGNPNWGTPQEVLHAVRLLFNGCGIDLDACSDPVSNLRVGATIFMTDALNQPWPTGRTCFINPPFSPAARAKALYMRWGAEYLAGTFEMGVAVRLLNGASAKYTLDLMRQTSAQGLILPGRPAFICPHLELPVNGNTHGIMLITVGVSKARVRDVGRIIQGLYIGIP